jgi:hypothetical protein
MQILNIGDNIANEGLEDETEINTLIIILVGLFARYEKEASCPKVS